MSSEAQRFAAAVLDAFEQAGHATDAQVGAHGGPSTSTMTKLRKAAAGEIEMPEPRNDTYTRIEQAAEWLPGSARKLWRTGVLPRRHAGLGTAIDWSWHADEAYLDISEWVETDLRGPVPQALVRSLDDEVLIAEIRRRMLWGREDTGGRGVPIRTEGHLSVAPDRTSDAIAAHDEAEPIAGETGHDEHP